MAEQNSPDDVEDEGSRQRCERRELQSTIQQLKKSINKNDKTRKKKVDGEIKALEEAFAKRWEHFSGDSIAQPEGNPPAQSEEIPAETEHVSRKARRLANKEKRQAESDVNQEVIDYDNQPETIRRQDESSSIEDQLLRRGLEVRSIASDGNCLFASIIDQTSDLTVRKFREVVTDYLRQHRSEYEPFIDTDYDLYCEKLAKENTWGGQVELQVCAKLLQRAIEIIQGDGNEPIRIECPSSTKPPIVITYHRYLYSNGEHYNSTTERADHEREIDEGGK